MAKNKKSGLRIGSYIIRPLGIIIIMVLLVALIVVGALVIFQSVSNSSPDAVEPDPTRQVIELTPAPSVEATEPATEQPTASPTPEPTPSLRSATIRSLGEILVENNIIASAEAAAQAAASEGETSRYNFLPIFEYVRDVIGNADYTVADIEGAMDNRADSAYSGTTPVNTPPHIMLALKDAGVDMLTMANDHALDKLFDGLQTSISNVTAAQLDYIGVATSQEEKDTPKVVEINGINVGFLNYTTSLGGMEEQSSSDALTYGVNTISNSNVVTDVQKAREAGADVIVAYISWGTMGQRALNSSDQNLAMAMNAAGVDVIIGFNPHTVLPAYWLEGTLADGTTQRTLCLCATGGLLSDQRSAYYCCGIIFEFTIQELEDGSFEITNLVYIPTYIWRYPNEESQVYEYRILAAGEWLEERPEGMSDTEYQQMQIVWQGIQEVMKQGNVNPTLSAN